jgi:hypothetical protein
MSSEFLTKMEIAEISIRPLGIVDGDFKQRLIERLCKIDDHSLAQHIQKSCNLNIKIVHPGRFQIIFN